MWSLLVTFFLKKLILEKFRWHPGFHRRLFSKLSGEEGTIAKRWCYSYVNTLVILKFWIFHNPLGKKLIRKKSLPYSQSSDHILRVKHTNISWNNQYRISHAHFFYPLVSNLIESLFKMKFGTQTFPNMLNLGVVFTSCFIPEIPFLSKFGPKIKIKCLRWKN